MDFKHTKLIFKGIFVSLENNQTAFLLSLVCRSTTSGRSEVGERPVYITKRVTPASLGSGSHRCCNVTHSNAGNRTTLRRFD